MGHYCMNEQRALTPLTASMSRWVGSLTNDHEDKDEGSHPCAGVEHDPDVVRQLIHIVHIRHKDGREQEPNGNTHL